MDILHFLTELRTVKKTEFDILTKARDSPQGTLNTIDAQLKELQEELDAIDETVKTVSSVKESTVVELNEDVQ